ncbi:unnamed protein product [Heligmosomoides polygyrus]|uniref:Uncharacterized protein n=1 Tax=Heligmosomoides polygyrus TaxID=6339 RepID=A0A183GDV0_HELPZ|nr:unnamed protein product [Heligmosomoides polygyrus]
MIHSMPSVAMHQNYRHWSAPDGSMERSMSLAAESAGLVVFLSLMFDPLDREGPVAVVWPLPSPRIAPHIQLSV